MLLEVMNLTAPSLGTTSVPSAVSPSGTTSIPAAAASPPPLPPGTSRWGERFADLVDILLGWWLDMAFTEELRWGDKLPLQPCMHARGAPETIFIDHNQTLQLISSQTLVIYPQTCCVDIFVHMGLISPLTLPQAPGHTSHLKSGQPVGTEPHICDGHCA